LGGPRLGCTKAQLLALLYKILDEISMCRDVECCKSVLNTYIAAVREKSYREIVMDIFA